MTQTVLITGCSSGLGKSTARLFATKGWNVVATMRRADRTLERDHPDHLFVQEIDVTDDASVAAAIGAGVDRFGRLDAIVNNAGISVLSMFEATPPEVIERIFQTNVFGAMRVARAAIPHLRAQQGGAIVNVSSGAGIAAMPLLSLYCASKFALEGFAESLSYELASQDIRVKLVEPGAMRTTAFTANTMSSSQEVALPGEYKAYFDHMLASMIDYPFASTEEAAVVDAVWRAVNDRSPRLRYPVGPDVAEYTRLRWSTSEDAYQAEMARLTGHQARLERND
jgi:NAD(P)-dependent dehydrogenase (short-subunit alcohol dehydrogenase family)